MDNRSGSYLNADFEETYGFGKKVKDNICVYQTFDTREEKPLNGALLPSKLEDVTTNSINLAYQRKKVSHHFYHL
jgi:hypothetical protein